MGIDPENEINTALAKVNEWLKPDDLTVVSNKEKFPKNKLGSYECGSVFEKTIQVNLDVENIIKASRESFIFEPNEQIRITIYHETGHALVEQILDWAENIPELEERINGEFGEKYFNVFNDDHLTEEQLVEDFALSFDKGYRSELKSCWEELREILYK